MKQTAVSDAIDSGDEAEINEKLKQVLWVTANSTDSLILVTDLSIKSF
jgi:regulator of protease activity HflC (stomatin/prohibitin superfamily)